MRSLLSSTRIGLMLVCLVGLGGCGQEEGDSADAGAAADAHDHGVEGPHGGHIIELGTEDYHAELTHDEEANRVGVYMLGGDAKTAAPIEAESVTINVSVDGEPAQYVLPAAPHPATVEVKGAYFELLSEPLHEVVSGHSDAPNTHARLNVTIDGKPYVGLIETEEHDHDHDHDHAH